MAAFTLRPETALVLLAVSWQKPGSSQACECCIDGPDLPRAMLRQIVFDTLPPTPSGVLAHRGLELCTDSPAAA